MRKCGRFGPPIAVTPRCVAGASTAGGELEDVAVASGVGGRRGKRTGFGFSDHMQCYT
jgi:hypothetical protein